MRFRRREREEAPLLGPRVIARIPVHFTVVEILDEAVTLRVSVGDHRGHEVTLVEDEEFEIRVKAYDLPEP